MRTFGPAVAFTDDLAIMVETDCCEALVLTANKLIHRIELIIQSTDAKYWKIWKSKKQCYMEQYSLYFHMAA